MAVVYRDFNNNNNSNIVHYSRLTVYISFIYFLRVASLKKKIAIKN